MIHLPILSLSGGLTAVIYTDTFQSVVMLIGSTVLAVIGKIFTCIISIYGYLFTFQLIYMYTFKSSVYLSFITKKTCYDAY